MKVSLHLMSINLMVPTRKLPDVTKLSKLEWNARIGLRDGIATTY